MRPAAAEDVVCRGAAGVSDEGGNAKKAASMASRRRICTFCHKCGVSESMIGQGNEKAAWRRSRHMPQAKAKPHIFGGVCWSDGYAEFVRFCFLFYGRINSEDVKD